MNSWVAAPFTIGSSVALLKSGEYEVMDESEWPVAAAVLT
jgi:hypothetical protein